MAERYSPKARERQRQHIQALMKEELHELFQDLDENANSNRSAIMWAIDLILWQFLKLKGSQYPQIHLGKYSWRFYMQMRRIQPKLCEEWQFCEKARDPKNTDRVDLADDLAYFLVKKGFHHIFPVDAAAVALLKIDPAEMCGCEETE